MPKPESRTEVPTISVEIPNRFETKRLEWQGSGAQVKLTNGEHEATFPVFVLDRVDNPLYIKGAKPRVIRVFNAGPGKVKDYVHYPTDDQDGTGLTEYLLDAEISDVDEYFRGEWPAPYGWLEDGGKASIFALADAVLAGEGAVFELGDGKQVTNLGAVALDQAGTAPVYKVRPAA